MILKSVRVKKFKSVADSGLVEFDGAVTCLVGKNESGKTAFLEALYRLNPLAMGHMTTYTRRMTRSWKARLKPENVTSRPTSTS